MTTLEQVRADREAREAAAKERASTLEKREYFADDNFVSYWENGKAVRAVECESHWDACLTMMAANRL